MKIFLAYSFREKDRKIVNDVSELLLSHVERLWNGERLGGEELTDAIKELIQKSDALVAILTRRAEDPETGDWYSHQWVRDELSHARDKGVAAIALVEEGVSTAGMQSGREYIPYDPEDPLPAFIALSKTISDWKRKVGRRLKVQVLPDELARKIRRGNGEIACQYRLYVEDRRTEWQQATLIPEPYGTFIWVNGVSDQCLIQLQVTVEAEQWLSDASSQWIQIKCLED